MRLSRKQENTGQYRVEAPFSVLYCVDTPKQTGERTEGFVLAHMLKLNFPASLPFGNNQRYDMVVERDGKLFKVQIKTGREHGSVLVFKSCSTHGITGKHRGYHGQIDVFVVFCPDSGKFYWIPVEDVPVGTPHLRLAPPVKNSSVCGYRWAKDYEF